MITEKEMKSMEYYQESKFIRIVLKQIKNAFETKMDYLSSHDDLENIEVHEAIDKLKDLADAYRYFKNRSENATIEEGKRIHREWSEAKEKEKEV